MFTRLSSQLTERENYKLLIGSIIPRPVAVVSTLTEKGNLNIAPFSYFNIVSSNPPIVSLAVQRKNEQMKDTAKNILIRKAAIIQVLDEQNVVEVNKTAATLPQEESELTLTNLTTKINRNGSIPPINEAKIVFETDLYDHLKIKNEQEVTADLFLLKIHTYQLNEEVYDPVSRKIDPKKLQPVSRLAGNDYATLGKIFTIPRPK
ncbi:flavin reductase family protein [Enterococcus hirae]|uniref:flavin reductase family protein n=1 Tax=Enterococcus TaxID=1350 RepID=UPI0009BE31E4|nr:flavin reductase family protein [Enterococcus hirae]EMF0061856.1 flavin reductase family protein [Enterococcus hirae]EMF0088750.1 flavin reductase family protein [Enterococcus hirae]EMF0178924.1 flavin reductase family protein [Enterococcus hirae]EMF0524653.1 flavin reductase family protein [Enterococcus hirae]MBA5268762.1 flavin reductase family protein [Enterococcus hirae]